MTDKQDMQAELAKIEQDMAGLKAILSGAALEAGLAQLREKKAALQAQLAGTGVIVQDSELTAGDRGVAGSSVAGHLITGDGNSIQTIINYYRDQAGQPPDEATLRRQVASYLTWMLERYGTIELRGIKREGVQVVQLNLETVYVPLQAQTYRRAGAKQIALDQVLRLGQHIVITGGPGCGKTTVLLHLAWTLTCAIGADTPALAQEKLGLSEFPPPSPEKAGGGLPLPILIPLSTYASYLRQLPPGTPAEKKTLAAFISDYLIQNQTSFELPPDFFKQLLRSGQRVILLLDGLDEVPNEAERAEVRQAIENLVTGREQMRVVVTCRTAAYKDRTALGKDFHEVQVLPLNEEHVENLIRHAYADIYRHEADAGKGKADELLQAIASLEAQRRQRFGEDTEPLIASPLLVRMLLVVHYSERRLPEQRAELYMKATDAMLLPEYSPDEAQANRLGGLVGGSREVHRELVQHLAFEMHRRGEIQGREIEEGDLRQILQNHPAYADLTADLITITRLRGTLLEERLGMYRFIHLAFQEYLAARYLAETVRSEKGLAGIVAFFEEGPILESWWREPALLVAGYLSVNVPASAQKYLLRLAGADEQAGQRRQTLPAEVQLAAAEVAGIAALEWPAAPPVLKDKLARRLADLFDTPSLLAQAEPTRRAAAGNALARLGDPRPGVTDPETMAFCYIPPGPFLMGSGDKDDLAYSEEKPLHEMNIPYGYWLARYPVTVAQFAAFVEASGYSPQDRDSLRGPANHPVVNVTWRDALAFCQWLTDYWQKQGFLLDGWRVTLPSEAEWEKAARGGLEYPPQSIIEPINGIEQWQPTPARQANPWPQRRYPWGDQIEAMLANYGETGLGSTSAVGCFPGGASPYGCQDMSGNVWEWTRSLWGKERGEPEFPYPYNPKDGREDLKAPDEVPRLLRGGAFSYIGRSVRCAFRYWPVPDYWIGSRGFRVVVSPFFS